MIQSVVCVFFVKNFKIFLLTGEKANLLICFKFVERFLKWSICLIPLFVLVWNCFGTVCSLNTLRPSEFLCFEKRPKLLLLSATEVYNYFVSFIGQKKILPVKWPISEVDSEADSEVHSETRQEWPLIFTA